ncbi:hypothetical protein CYMTET_49776 [Cymbomonas tetramitiformis]|uniref:VWFA domain-containing protein n=1 Tax=Cymbomonas tetramitiformis TaxID=36881 RepID=A0AAE0BQN7_9CHLO|nr:hypothetical protein CYMTET_49776 [Cymbomonas tetramitiformis]
MATKRKRCHICFTFFVLLVNSFTSSARSSKKLSTGMALEEPTVSVTSPNVSAFERVKELTNSRNATTNPQASGMSVRTSKKLMQLQGNDLRDDTIAWSEAISSKIAEVVETVMRTPTIQRELNEAAYFDSSIEGFVKVAQGAAEVEVLFKSYFDKLRNIVTMTPTVVQRLHSSPGTLQPGRVRSDDDSVSLPQSSVQSAPFGDTLTDLTASAYRTAVSGAGIEPTMVEATAAFDTVFTENAKNDMDIRYQYIALEEDIFRSFPAQKWSKTSEVSERYDDFQPRLQPWYVSAVTGRKTVVMIVDLTDSSATPKALRVLDTLAREDKFAIVAFNQAGVIETFDFAGCGSPVGEPVRALKSLVDHAKSELSKAVENLAAGSDGVSASSATDAAISEAVVTGSRLLALSSRGDYSCGSTLILLTTIDIESVETITSVQYNVSMNIPTDHFRFLVYGIGMSEFSESLNELACRLSGVYRHDFMTVDTSVALSYYRFISQPPENQGAVQAAYTWTEGSSGGLRPDLFSNREDSFLTMSVPLFDYTYSPPKLLGVCALDIVTSKLKDTLDGFKFGKSFMMLLSPYGDALYHATQSVYKKVYPVGFGRDISNFEAFEVFNKTIRENMLISTVGSETVTVARAFKAGDSAYEGVETKETPTTYFWQRLGTSPFVLSFVQAQEDSFVRNFNFKYKDRLLRYAKLDSTSGYEHPKNKDLFQAEIINQDNCELRDADGNVIPENCKIHPAGYKTGAISTEAGVMMYSPESWEFPNAVEDTSTWRDDADWVNNFHKFINAEANAVSEYPFLSSEVMQFNNLHRRINGYLEHDVVEKNTVWNYYGDYVGSAVIYPASDWGPGWDPTRRPWYARGISNEGLFAISTPYIDAGGAGLMNTVSVATYRRRDPVDGPEIQDDFVLGVSGYDYVYPTFHDFVSSSTAHINGGCSAKPVWEQTADDPEPMCFLLDTAGLLLSHSDFLVSEEDAAKSGYNDVNGDIGAWPISNVFIGVKEPLLATALLEAKFLVENTGVLSIDGQQLLNYFTVDETILESNGGTISGEWVLTKTTGTNAFLIAVKGYERSANYLDCSPVQADPAVPVEKSGCDGLVSHYDGSDHWQCSMQLMTSSDLNQLRTAHGDPDHQKCALNLLPGSTINLVRNVFQF